VEEAEVEAAEVEAAEVEAAEVEEEEKRRFVCAGVEPNDAKVPHRLKKLFMWGRVLSVVRMRKLGAYRAIPLYMVDVPGVFVDTQGLTRNTGPLIRSGK